MKQKSMIVAGVMSGTSADGIDVCLIRIGNARITTGEFPRIKYLALESFRWSSNLRSRLLAAMEGSPMTAHELAQLHWRLGEVYADAVIKTLDRHPQYKVNLIGCHGQTVYHQATPAKFLGQDLRCTWQLGEPAIIATRTDIPVVSDFRPADMAVGGQGAPLVPIFDYLCFRSATRNRLLQNLGGIGNVTVIPAGASPDHVFAFDTGPGNMLIDACMNTLYNKPYDRNGSIARTGKVLTTVLERRLREKYFAIAPPRSAGREQFGRAYADSFIADCKKLKAHNEDIITTATALTADSVQASLTHFVDDKLAKAPTDFVISGGGAHNSTLLEMIRARLAPRRYKFIASDALGVPAQAKESAAFALLAWLTWHHRPGNIPTATGAARPAILGRITHV